ncbi:hypothetical protein [Sphingobacterium sp. SYP-B4668]|uniref:hypothetical protein n=1 Tax=Sphingobacterium sp. SYP-B4668 TaxID=2996035 RepID=UPI0022DD4AFE|nr:hypothetical protein [Sphingobacterium sp. SYP-B4668]
MMKIMGLLLVATIFFTACSKDDDPADNDIFIGNYKGKISYTDLGNSENNKPLADGTVNVKKLGNTYYFSFSNDIPDLNGVEFEKKGDNVLVNIDSKEGALIRIDAGKLTIAFTKDNKIWTADCQR